MNEKPTNEKEKLDKIIEGYKSLVEHLESQKDGSPEDINQAIKDANLNGYCCGTCIAVSSICTPDQTPNKCKGGCTAISFAF